MTDTELIVEPGRQDLVIRRTFDAPADLVWAAYTDPVRVPRGGAAPGSTPASTRWTCAGVAAGAS